MRTKTSGVTVRRCASIDVILRQHRIALGADFHTYRHHVYRGLNYQLALLGRDRPSTTMQLAWAVHDLGMWTAGTFDYLGPSAGLARRHAPAVGRVDLPLALTMIATHHRVRSVPDPEVETFRRADLVDVLHGLPPTASGRVPVRAVTRVFPYLGLHRCLLRRAAAYACRHPRKPLPMVRW
ncbi:hypothetical protein SAM23877_7287 [Streptomyces ambofaciens ATCC 23877]|uniref:HD domain-containing protein n=1 Tax=Streptomyces ambofaciens (strain ATCC 23877 / 3486 / DSM 40053 / JCM 4204 / NBRC 12836 / NRRL B-2516) TaxID=278992 RepID=A0AC25_STRA7|nr:hypothetical protein [Streptomyces ambofaciens]AKZ60330.1 hypothetical protein SAM23877_7287 [Streptomyces ambofaciens ATCC 23877]CAJ88029.1 conserved hypothetical protein [Streptomyces ambofaciens ATCC 23877]